MAEASVRTFNRDYVRISPIPNAAALVAIDQSMEDYNTVHPHSWLGYAHPGVHPFPTRRVSGLTASTPPPKGASFHLPIARVWTYPGFVER